MPYLMVRHRVEDFGRWKAAFDMGLDMRHVSGRKPSRVFDVDVEDSSVVVYSQWDSIERARNFIESDELNNDSYSGARFFLVETASSPSDVDLKAVASELHVAGGVEPGAVVALEVAVSSLGGGSGATDAAL